MARDLAAHRPAPRGYPAVTSASQTAVESWGPEHSSCTGCKAPSVFRGFGHLHCLLRPPPACLVVDLTADRLQAGLRPPPRWAASYLPTRRFCHHLSVQMWKPRHRRKLACSGVIRFVDSTARMGAGQPPTTLLCILLLRFAPICCRRFARAWSVRPTQQGSIRCLGLNSVNEWVCCWLLASLKSLDC